MKIGVIGLGYVGYSISILYSIKHSVFAVDIDKSKVDKLNNKSSLLKDNDAEKLLSTENLNLSCSTSLSHVSECTVIFICLPTNFDHKKNSFDTSVIEETLQTLSKTQSKDTLYIIKSTVPIGFTKGINERLGINRVMFSPEFLREGTAIRDNFYPDRIIIGGNKKYHSELLDLLSSITKDKKTLLLSMSSSEAESVKLLSNTFLAMRVSFFNELDSLSMELGIDSKKIIDGISADQRIGNHYNNPSFGYGGYCLPKDTRQLFSQAKNIVPSSIFNAIIQSNEERIEFLAKKLINSGAKVIGFYGLAMKKGSDNFRESSILKMINIIQSNSEVVIKIYDPNNLEPEVNGINQVKDFKEFLDSCEIIVANRMDNKISPYKNKIFSRDVYERD